MLNNKLLAILGVILLISLSGCGQKGPLYEVPEVPSNEPVTVDNEQQ
ncbi:LPS translocon maturation chaperone LptM [Thalassotalea maritima]